MKAIVVAGGDAAAEDAAQLEGADLLIAADSGLAWLDALAIRPQLVIGDMDSVDPRLLERVAAEGVTIVRHPADKDASDAELALAWAIREGADEVILLGAVGGSRLDHELANVLLLADPGWLPARLQVVVGGTSIRPLHGGGQLELNGAPGDGVTLLPVNGDAVGVRTSGLRYPLAGETLPIGRSRGLSNTIEGPPASVSLERGTLLVVESRKEAQR